MERIKKHQQKVFKDNGVDVIIDCIMKIVNYLDVTFNLNDGTYQPYQKLDNMHKPCINRIDKHFHKIFNRNSVSFNCTKSRKTIIN